jgi:hypothetical protein
MLNTLTLSFIGSLVVGCGEEKENPFAVADSEENSTTSDSDDTDDTDDTDTGDTDDTDDTDDTNPDDTGFEDPEDSGDSETSEITGDDSFDEVGDVVIGDSDAESVDEGCDNETYFDLTDAGGEDNTEHEFYLVFVNTGEDDMSYTLSYGSVGEARHCDDGIDNDGDGYIDCDDSDGDGYADDSDCRFDEACGVECESGGDSDGGDEPTGEEGGGEEGGGEGAEGPPNFPRVHFMSPSSKKTGRSGQSAGSGQGKTGGQAGLPALSPTPPPPSYSDSDIGSARQEFRVRDSLNDSESYTAVEGTLWAVGDSVNIWVDSSLPVDYDENCDGIIETPGQIGGLDLVPDFDNCDLTTISNIVDINIFPNLQSMFGNVSDVNGDGKITILISPVLNLMSVELDSGCDEDDDTGCESDSSDAANQVASKVISSFTLPSVDLEAYNPSDNALSNYQEIIYIYAPDPYGYYNTSEPVSFEDYIQIGLGSSIAYGLSQLISYNYHVTEAEGDEEEIWIRAGLGFLAADLTGFGALNHQGVWDYLDSNQAFTLTDIEAEEGELVSIDSRAQYLFFRWLLDAYGSQAIQDLVQSELTSTDAVTDAVPDDSEMDDLVLRWQVAMLSSHSTLSTSGLDIDPTEFEPYSTPISIQAPHNNPTTGDLYGANGYQMGIDIGGENDYVIEGTTNQPATVSTTQMGHTDFLHFAYGQEFFGYVASGYSAQVVRLVDLPFEETELTVISNTDNYHVAIVRAEDPVEFNYAKENSLTPLDVNTIDLPELPTDGKKIYGLGELYGGASGSLSVSTIDPDGGSGSGNVYDTDRWLLSMDSYPTGQAVDVAIWMNLKRSDMNGSVGLADPWMAVVDSDYLAVPTHQGFTSCPDEDSAWNFPNSLLEHLFYQVIPSTIPFCSETDEIEAHSCEDLGSDDEDEDTAAEEDTGGFDPCGSENGDSMDCDEDWDGDGVHNEDEPLPQSIVEQVQVMQCNLSLSHSNSGFTALTEEDIIDFNEWNIRGDDCKNDFAETLVCVEDEPIMDRTRHLGGASLLDTDSDAFFEGSYVEMELTGGEDYIIVVGGNEYEGTVAEGYYELVIQRTP